MHLLCNIIITRRSVWNSYSCVSGTEVSIKLTTDDGQVLLDTRTSSFPQAANYYGLGSSGGTIIMTYQVTTEGTTTTDENGNTVNVPGTTEDRSFTRRIEFVKEQE